MCTTTQTPISASLYIINIFIFKYKWWLKVVSLYVKTRTFWFYSLQGTESKTCKNGSKTLTQSSYTSPETKKEIYNLKIDN